MCPTRSFPALCLVGVVLLLIGCGGGGATVGNGTCTTNASAAKVAGGWVQRLGPVSVGGFDEDGATSVKPTIDGKLFVPMPVDLRVPGSSRVTMTVSSNDPSKTARITHTSPGAGWEDAEQSAEFALTGDPATAITPRLTGYLVLNEPGCVTVTVLVNGTSYGPIAAIVSAEDGTQPPPKLPQP